MIGKRPDFVEDYREHGVASLVIEEASRIVEADASHPKGSPVDVGGRILTAFVFGLAFGATHPDSARAMADAMIPTLEDASPEMRAELGDSAISGARSDLVAHAAADRAGSPVVEVQRGRADRPEPTSACFGSSSWRRHKLRAMPGGERNPGSIGVR